MIRNNKPARILLAVLVAFAFFAGASSTQRWIQGSRVEFLKGEPESASITSDGTIMLPPVADKLFPAENRSNVQPFIWNIVANRSGGIFVSGGNDGIIYDIQGNPVHDADKPEIYAMAVGPDNLLYFGTSPSGKVYRLNAGGQAEEFFSPSFSEKSGEAGTGAAERYIWDMTFDTLGNLYIATGIEGRVYKIATDGKQSVVFDSDEAHITCITVDSRGRVLFGSDPGGQVFQMDQSGKVFVLFDSPMKEISNIAVSSDGIIYVTGVAKGALKVDEKAPKKPQATQGPTPLLTRTSSVTVASATDGNVSNGEKSALYRILADNSVEKIWSSVSEVAYSLTVDSNSQVIFGTGPKGLLIAIDQNGTERVLRKLDGSQVTALTNARGALYAGVSNLGAVYRISSRQYANNGTFISQVKDTGTVSNFGAIRWHGDGSRLTLHTRTGNTAKPDNTWSDWSEAYSDAENAKIASPSARYIQWKAELTTLEPEQSPILKSVSIYYLQRNVRPRITRISVLPTGITFKPSLGDSEAKRIPPEIVQELRMHKINAGGHSSMGKAIFQREMRSFSWSATDTNNDELIYHIWFRRIEETQWAPLANNVTNRYFSFDTRDMSDGTYVVRIEADDNPSNPKDRALKGHLDTQPFEIDNTPPSVNNLNAAVSGNSATISFEATDSTSTIKTLRLKINSGKWMIVLPEDGIPDSATETVSTNVTDLPTGEHLITIQVLDELYNVGSGSTKITVR